MIAIKKLLCALIFVLITNESHAENSDCMTNYEEDIYPHILLDKKIAIRFKMSDASVDPYEDAFPITIVAMKCNSGIEEEIAELPYLGDTGRIESAFLVDSDFDNTAELFVIHSVTLYSDTGISYSSNYFTTLVYKRFTPLTYEYSERMSTYFGEGGDILLSPESDTEIYSYPYKSEANIRNKLISAQYKLWFENKKTNTKILSKTYLHEQPNTVDKTSIYFIAGDEVQVLDQSAGWLEVMFHNKTKGDIKGWIQCKDTLHCTN